MYNVYDLNLAYENFVGRFGIEPNGLLMDAQTFELIKRTMQAPFEKLSEDVEITFRGIPIFISEQVGHGTLRFII